jgi:hypothetical protein
MKIDDITPHDCEPSDPESGSLPRFHFQCALCERACEVPSYYQIRLTIGTKCICNGCFHQLNEVNIEVEQRP